MYNRYLHTIPTKFTVVHIMIHCCQASLCLPGQKYNFFFDKARNNFYFKYISGFKRGLEGNLPKLAVLKKIYFVKIISKSRKQLDQFSRHFLPLLAKIDGHERPPKFIDNFTRLLLSYFAEFSATWQLSQWSPPKQQRRLVALVSFTLLSLVLPFRQECIWSSWPGSRQGPDGTRRPRTPPQWSSAPPPWPPPPSSPPPVPTT